MPFPALLLERLVHSRRGGWTRRCGLHRRCLRRDRAGFLGLAGSCYWRYLYRLDVAWADHHTGVQVVGLEATIGDRPDKIGCVPNVVYREYVTPGGHRGAVYTEKDRVV